MPRYILRLAGAVIVAVHLSGCAAVLLGAGAAGGYAVSRDSVKNSFDLSQETVFQRSLAVMKEMGLVTLEDSAHGLIRAKVEGVNVTITVKPITKKSVELKVKARNQWLLPEIDVAQAVYTKILERLP